jgi:short-subunit dehydrogenase
LGALTRFPPSQKLPCTAPAGCGVQVITVLPGIVETRMTAGMDLPKRLTAQPTKVAQAILRAQPRGRHIVYMRSIWRWIMAVIRTLPEPIFMRTKF